VELVEVSDLSVPGLTAGPRTVSCSTAQQPGLRSLLGLDVFGDHALLLDGPATRLDVLPSGVLGTDRPLQRGARGHCSLPVALPGCSARALWDTGAGITVVSSALHDAQPGLFTPMRTATGTDATGLQRVTDVHWMAGYRIGDVDFTGHPVAVVDLPQEAGSFDLVLGQPTLRQAVWTIDLPAGRWSVSAARPAGVG
jgi:hypothetical protein